MWSETVSMINLQTLKSILKVHKNAPYDFFKFKNFLWRGHGFFKFKNFLWRGHGLPGPTPFESLQFAPLDNTSGSATGHRHVARKGHGSNCP